METYGLIGLKLGHSFSRKFFTEMFLREGIEAEYLNFELDDIGELMEVIAEHPHLKGLNVTIPYKEQILPYIDRLSPEAEEIGAVNTVKIVGDTATGDFSLEGYNTDIIGFKESISPLIPEGAGKALVLGTGGASKAVIVALRQLGIEPLQVSRTAAPGRITYDDLKRDPSLIESHPVIVNTTPLGMFPDVDSAPDIPYDYLTPANLCYDLVYNPDPTLFMTKAATMGAKICSGLAMLKGQALASWKIWNSDTSAK